MSIGPAQGIPGNAAGVPLSQTKGAQIELSQRDAIGEQRHIASEEKAEHAAGIGQTSEDQEASERDADGRRLWEVDGRKPKLHEANPTERQSRDASGESGNALDVTG
jgi:hypothetical protein